MLFISLRLAELAVPPGAADSPAGRARLRPISVMDVILLG